MDSNGNGLLSPREVEEAAMVRRRKNDSKNLSVFLVLHFHNDQRFAQSHYGEALSQLVLANIMATADFDGDGHVSPEEFVRICLQNEALFEDGAYMCVTDFGCRWIIRHQVPV